MRSRRSASRFVALTLTSLIATLVWVAPVAAAVPTSGWYTGSPDGPLTSDAATFSALPHGASDQNVDVRALGLGVSKEILLEGPDGTQIAPGAYPDATMVKEAGHPYLYVWASCNYGETGSFVVHEVAFDGDGLVTKLAVDYSVQCINEAWGDQGAVRFDSSWPVKALQPVGNYVDLGEVDTGTTSRQTRTIRSVGTEPMTISAIDITGSGAAAWSIDNDDCAGVPVAPGDTCTFDVVASPTTSGDVDASIFVSSDTVTPNIRTTSLHAHGRFGTTTTIETSPSIISEGQGFEIHATVHPTPEAGYFTLELDGSLIGSSNMYINLGNNGVGIPVSGLPVGVHTMRARFTSSTNAYGHSDSGTVTFSVGHATTTTITTSRTTVYGTQAPTINATVAGPSDLTGGTLTITDYTTMTVLGSVSVTGSTRTLRIAPVMPVGPHNVVAEYSGTTDFGSSAAGIGVYVLADDGVALTKSTVSPTTFYPYKDSYRDYVAIGGTLDEPATVSISIYNSAKHRVTLKSLGTRTGAYTYHWTGRSSSGAILPTGKYRIVQTLHDTTGHTLVKTTYVTLSKKRLYTYTTTLTKTAKQYSKRATSWIGWQFGLPSATVYKSMTLRAYGVTGVPPVVFGGWDFRVCPVATGWNTTCVIHTNSLSFTVGWASIGLSPTWNRHGHTVRAMVFAPYLASGAVAKVALKVTYSLLR